VQLISQIVCLLCVVNNVLSQLQCNGLVCRLTELKAESRRVREQREIDTATSVAETRRRREIVEKQFYEWNDGKKVPCILIHTALQTYADMHDGSLLFSRPLDPVDKDGGFYLADYLTVSS